MQCADVIHLADSYLADQLLVETNHAILHHLAGCRRCREEIDDRRRLRVALRGAVERSPILTPSSAFLAAIGEQTRTSERLRHAHRGWHGALAVAAMLTLVAGAFASQMWLSARRVGVLARAAVGDHRDCALQFRLSEQPLSLEEAARRFDPVYRRFATVSPTTDRIGNSPLTVIGRHSCVFQGRRFAHLVLSYNGELVSVLVPVGQPAATMDIRSLDGQRVLAFQAGRATAFVVSTLSDADLRSIAATMQASLTAALADA